MTTPITLTIETTALGQRRTTRDEWTLPVALPTAAAGAPAALPLGALITAIVSAEVAAFHERQQARRLDRVLAPEQIAADAARGKISPTGTEPQAVRVADAVATALQAFADRLYLVLVDGAPADALDQVVTVGETSRVRFVRLVALIGG
ncbi:MAG TPA: hypothetical protein VGR57_09945 [Ktedonobacterales bacterium]|nr:hypothetical protein [Ktedonobacterales bacterium]